MPTKLNRAGQEQNYVPAGNGDASGEYGDNATGSNIHFVNFKKPDKPSEIIKELKDFDERQNKISKEQRTLLDTKRTNKKVFYLFDKSNFSITQVDEQFYNDHPNYLPWYSKGQKVIGAAEFSLFNSKNSKKESLI